MDKILRKTAWFLATHIDDHLRNNAKKRMAQRLTYEVGIEEVIFEGLQKLGLGGKKDA